MRRGHTAGFHAAAFQTVSNWELKGLIPGSSQEEQQPMAHNSETEERIRERAYQIWIEQGQPHGRDTDHWYQAEAELVSRRSPPLQPLVDDGDGEAPSEAPVGGVNPDEITR
jgi:DUF2934 family protein